MHIQTRRNDLLQALQTVIGVVERRQSLPILANVLMEARDDQLVLSATDLELQLRTQAGIQNLQPGSTTAPARKMLDICRSLPEGAEIDLELNGKRLSLKSGRSRFVLSTMPPEEFPAFPEIHVEHRLELASAELKRLMQRTLFAMAQQDVRYYLNGLLLEVTPQRVRAVATDGHRLALAQQDLDTGVDKSIQLILPRKTVLELQRLLDFGPEKVQITLAPTQVEVKLDSITLGSKVIDGRFPDYERVIPENPERIVIGDSAVVRSALSRAAILANEKFRGVRLQFEPGVLRIQSQNPEQEEAEEEVEIEYDGTSLEIGFNVGYLLDAIEAVGDAKFVLELRGSDGSGLIRDPHGGPSRYVVMPMRL